MKWIYVACLSAGTVALAQQPNGAIRGTVVDSTGALIPGASIVATGPDGVIHQTITGSDGTYVLPGLRPGEYALRASAPGFMQPKLVKIPVSDHSVPYAIELDVAANSISIDVTTDDRSVVSAEPDQNASATHIEGESLKSIADDPDDLVTDLQALAGPSAGLAGAQVYIDGLTAGDATLPDKSTIKEIRINQNPFAPEFDSVGFGRVELLTKAGADAVHASAFFNYGNEVFNSRNPYATQKPPFDLKQYGGSISGPITGKLSYFFDINKRDIENGAVINAVTLDPSTLRIVDPYTQVYSSPFRFLRLSPRIDFKVNAKHTLMGRYGFTKNDYDHSGVGGFDLVSQSADAHLREHSIQLTETALLSAKVVSETQFLYLHQYHTHRANSTGPTLEVQNAFNGGPDPQSFSSYTHHHYQVQNVTTLVENSHTLRLGTRLRAVSLVDTSHENFSGTYTFGGAYAPVLDGNDQPVALGASCKAGTSNTTTGCTTISSIEQYRRTLVFQKRGLSSAAIRQLGGGATQLSLNAGAPSVQVGMIDLGVFAGDDWRVRPSLTLSYGLRYEMQTGISDHADFAPRVGVAWSPAFKGKPSKTVVRGGFGLFFDRFDAGGLTTTQRYNGTSQQQYLISNPDTYPNVPDPSTLAANASSQVIQTISPKMRAPYLLNGMVSLERQIFAGTTATISYIQSHGLHQFRSRNINAPLAGSATGAPGQGTRPYPGQGPIWQMESEGTYNQRQVVFNVNSRIGSRVTLFGAYTLNYARSNTDGINTFPANQYDLGSEYGPAEDDIRHRGSVGGTITPRWGIRLNPLLIVQTGPPFNIITSQDVYGTGILNARPGFATDATRPGLIATSYGLLDPNPIAGEKLVPRNYGRGPGQVVLNLRAGREFTLRKNSDASPTAKSFAAPLTMDLSVSARNLLNHTNPGAIIGNVNSTLFAQANSIASGTGAFSGSANNRRLEFQLQFSF